MSYGKVSVGKCLAKIAPDVIVGTALAVVLMPGLLINLPAISVERYVGDKYHILSWKDRAGSVRSDAKYRMWATGQVTPTNALVHGLLFLGAFSIWKYVRCVHMLKKAKSA